MSEAPREIWLLPFDGEQRCWAIDPDPSGLGHEAEADRYIRADLVQELIEAAYLAGFNSSGEGYNWEWPFSDKGRDPALDNDWIAERDRALAALRKIEGAKA